MKEIIVVIDPGHGGTNEGALFADYIEKEITLKVAKQMKEELDKYEGITTYLTRTEDIDLSLKERVEYADKVNADFLFCLHFNMSENHDLYGAECWISAFDKCYAKAYDFSTIEMDMLTELGLFDRGIKTRISDKTSKDYYGIIRNATEKNIPSVIIEHCHLDNHNDFDFCNQDSWLTTYGKLDATAVAKYYGLKSEILGVDYSNEKITVTDIPLNPVYPDSTAPEFCRVNYFELDQTTGYASVQLETYDPESRPMYYKYSLDGGESYTEFLPWTEKGNSLDFSIEIPEGTNCTLVFGVDNLYNLTTYSEAIEIPAYFLPHEEETIEEMEEVEEVIPVLEIKKVEVDVNSSKSIYILDGILIAILCITICITLCVVKNITRKSKAKHKL